LFSLSKSYLSTVVRMGVLERNHAQVLPGPGPGPARYATLGGYARDVLEVRDAHAQLHAMRVVRYGREEFSLVLPGAGEPQAMRVAARIHQEIREQQLGEVGITVGITVSTGAARTSPLSRYTARASGRFSSRF
jgi:hypothetical protein